MPDRIKLTPMVRLLLAATVVVAFAGCTGGSEQSEAEKLRSIDEELATLPDPGPGLGEGTPPPETAAGWRTDFGKRAAPLSEFQSGGPPKDGIPAIDRPKHVAVADVDFLEDREPVIVVEAGGELRAYPIQILIWHEIVNDTIGGTPVAVTFCPLCNTAIAFDRRVGGRVLDFGTTGKLRNSDLVMYDRQTESWWQQFGGEALVGHFTGTTLRHLPAEVLSWREFKAEHPHALVLSRDTGHSRPYGRNPYAGYDDVDSPPIFPARNEHDDRLLPKERVVYVKRGDASAAIPFSVLQKRKRITVRVGGDELVVRWRSGVASALDRGEVAAGRDVGAADVRLDGELVPFDQPFWFAVAAFDPDARVIR
jgi:hypothetical protein